VLAREIAYENDEVCVQETPEQRWRSMRAWVREHLRETV
jgi:hypothetical protein